MERGERRLLSWVFFWPCHDQSQNKYFPGGLTFNSNTKSKTLQLKEGREERKEVFETLTSSSDMLGWFSVALVFDSPYAQHASLSCVGRKTRNLPLVRRKLALHVHSVVVYDSGRSVDYFRGLLHNDILTFPVRSL